MKLIKPSFKILEQEPGINGIYKAIERAGRVCYKSEDKITETSAKEFVDRMIKSGHWAMLEHGTVYLKIPVELVDLSDTLDIPTYNDDIVKYQNNKYSTCHLIDDIVIDEDDACLGYLKGTPDVIGSAYITTNYRVLIENNWLDDLEFLCEPTKFHKKRISVKFICDRGVSHEFVRNRGALGNAFAQESTRYCNYSKDKFNNEITFIIPPWVDPTKLYKNSIITKDEIGDLISEYYFHLTGVEKPYFKSCKITTERNFKASLEISEQLYFELLKQGWTPQQARSVLPNALKTELIVTGFTSDWKHFFELRDSNAAHPQARELAQPLHEEFKVLAYV